MTIFRALLLRLSSILRGGRLSKRWQADELPVYEMAQDKADGIYWSQEKL
jgi:hypothetical protein